MSRISVTAVLSGAVFDVLVLVIFGFVMAFVFVMLTGAGAATDVEAFYAASPDIDLIMAVLNYAALVVIVPTGGYLAAKIARKGPLVNGALSSFLCVLTYAYSLMGWYPQNLASSVIAIATAPLLGLLGGYLYQRRMRNFLQVQA